jgi:phosphonate transport system substrate-binding protein
MQKTIRFATFLAPSMYPVYEAIARYVGKRLGIQTELFVGSSFDQFSNGEAEVGFICGLPYVELARQAPAPVEPLVAPVLEGERYGGKPVYFSDVIVRADSPYQSFLDLRGCSWSYNDLDSHSGYNITRYHLVKLGETGGFFGRVVEAGFHQRSIELVVNGEVDASAIDSQVLAIAMRDRPELAQSLKVIDSLGPATIQPVVTAARLPDSVKAELREVFVEMGADPAARADLQQGFVESFVPVEDATYDDIRLMLAAAESAGFMTIR